MSLIRYNGSDNVVTLADVLNTLQNLGIKVASLPTSHIAVENIDNVGVQLPNLECKFFTFINSTGIDVLVSRNGFSVTVFNNSYFTFSVNSNLNEYTLISTSTLITEIVLIVN